MDARTVLSLRRPGRAGRPPSSPRPLLPLSPRSPSRVLPVPAVPSGRPSGCRGRRPPSRSGSCPGPVASRGGFGVPFCSLPCFLQERLWALKDSNPEPGTWRARVCQHALTTMADRSTSRGEGHRGGMTSRYAVGRGTHATESEAPTLRRGPRQTAQLCTDRAGHRTQNGTPDADGTRDRKQHIVRW